MTLDQIFQLSNTLAMLGWLSLLASPWIPALSQRLTTIAIPSLLAVAYAGLVLSFWSRSSGGFGSLDDVALLFETRGVLLAGWIHYLAFDLFVGAWEARTARREGMPFLLVVPCLALTFLFGPAGYLLFTVLRGLNLRVVRESHV